MKLTENQIEMINRYTDERFIDREKLITYLEAHKTIKNDVFAYCKKFTIKLFDSRGYCAELDNEPMYSPVEREIFIRRVPFYFFQMHKDGDQWSGLSQIIPIIYRDNTGTEDYDAFYADLEWMFYDLHIPLNVICDYCRDQIAATRVDAAKEEKIRGLFNLSIPDSYVEKGGLTSRDLFRYWRHYLHLCAETGRTNLIPNRFITAYNEALVNAGQEPIIYYPVRTYGSAFTKEDAEIVCCGYFPCDSRGDPIMEWTSIRVKHSAGIAYKTEKSQCGELRITLGPRTIIYCLDDEPEDDEEPAWQQLYAGPQTMEFDNEALREFRSYKGLTQREVAEAIGTSVRTYQKWECGETTPDGHYLLRLMNWLDINDVQSIIKYIDLPEETGR